MITKKYRCKKERVSYAARWGTASCVAGTMPLDSPIPSIVAHFKQVMALRPELRSAKLIHITMSLAEKDRSLSPTEWGEISQFTAEYIGLNHGPWQAWVHTDGHTPHLHLFASAIRFDGHRIESRDHFKQLRKIARQIEETYGLWRVGDHPGAPILPPKTTAPQLPGPQFELSEAKLCFRHKVKDTVYEILRNNPGLRLPEFRTRLAQHGIELVPKLSIAGDKLVGLGFRIGDGFEIASKVDKSFSLAGLQKRHGVAYDPHQDLAALRDSFVIPGLGMTYSAVPTSPTLVDIPAPVEENPRPPLSVSLLTPKQEYRNAVRQIALGVAHTVWATLGQIKIEPAKHRPRFYAPSRHRPRI